jgi:hypothetical protein
MEGLDPKRDVSSCYKLILGGCSKFGQKLNQRVEIYKEILATNFFDWTQKITDAPRTIFFLNDCDGHTLKVRKSRKPIMKHY